MENSEIERPEKKTIKAVDQGPFRTVVVGWPESDTKPKHVIGQMWQMCVEGHSWV